MPRLSLGAWVIQEDAPAVGVVAAGGVAGAGVAVVSAFASVWAGATVSSVFAGEGAWGAVVDAPGLRLPYSVTYQPLPLRTKEVLEMIRCAVFLQ